MVGREHFEILISPHNFLSFLRIISDFFSVYVLWRFIGA